jgi:hypothetical protein
MAFSLYILVIATAATIKGQRMALHGNIDQDLVRSEIPANLGFSPGMIGERATAPSFAAARTSVEPPPVARMASPQELSQEQLEVTGDDVARAIDALRAVQPSLLIAFGASLFTFVSGAVAMVWIKTEPIHFARHGIPNNHIAVILTAIFVALLLSLLAVYAWISSLFRVRQFHDAKLSGLPEQLHQPLVVNRVRRGI